jgi:hypothetical protein
MCVLDGECSSGGARRRNSRIRNFCSAVEHELAIKTCVGESDLNRSDEKTMLKLMQERDDSKNSHPALIGEGHGEYLGAQAAFGVACGS